MQTSLAGLPSRRRDRQIEFMIIVDETIGGNRLHTFTIESLDEKLTVREIIRARIWQEVQEYNSQQRAVAFHGLIQPTEAERRLNEAKAPAFNPIDWEKQFETAVRAFQSNGFFILIGDRQAESLDEVFTTGAETEVSFVKFTPLVGG
jgi:hypothetical protein